MSRLDEYERIVGRHVIEDLQRVAMHLEGKSVTHVNSTAMGGGVAEILSGMVPLMKDLGIDCKWRVIKGGEDFYAVTKKFHNALHGKQVELSPKEYQVYENAVDTNLQEEELNADFVFIHDPQPAAMVKSRKGESRWIWRCHIDVSNPSPEVWGFFKPYVEKFDAAVFSAPAFSREIAIPEVMIPPSIDPLSEKNREMEPDEIKSIMERLQIPTDKPLVTQVSRFDRFKDPVGVIEAFQMVEPYTDARLLLVGGSATDDPEGVQVYDEVREKAHDDDNIIVLSLPSNSNIEINAIQRASAVVIQKSLREGFGLTVSEALWKSRPVIAGAVGGIPLQIAHKYSGILIHSVDGTAYWLKQLLHEPAFAKKLGDNGREHVRNNFLLTRHLREYLLLFLFTLDKSAETINL